MDTNDDRSKAKPRPPEPAEKQRIRPTAVNPPFSSPCLLDEDDDFDPNYLPDYTRGPK